MNGTQIAEYIKAKELVRMNTVNHAVEMEIEIECEEIENKQVFAKFEKIDLN